MANFNSQKLIDEFLANGGKIEVLPTVVSDRKELTTTNAHKKTIQLLTLGEADDLYGERKKSKKTKPKEVDQEKLKGINKDLIPKNLHFIFDKNTGGSTDEANSN